MSERKFVALGTSSQVPTRKRNHNGYFLRWDEQGFLFDPGEGTQRQMILSGISTHEISKIFITHFHGDHCLGLAGVIQRISLDKVAHQVEIYYPASGEKYYQNLKEASIFFNAAKLKEIPIQKEGVIFEDETFTIETLPLDHGVDTWGYRIQEKERWTLLPKKLEEFGLQGSTIRQLQQQGSLEWKGKVILIQDVSRQRPGQSMAFVMDTRMCANAVLLARNADLLVCESTYLSSEAEEALSHGHLTAAQAAQIAKESGTQQLVLTHFSQRYLSIKDFVQEAETIFSKVIAVKDGDVVIIPRPPRILE